MEKNEQQNNYYWSEVTEPHFARRKAILKKYPEVSQLFGVDPWLKYTTVLLVLAQLAIGLFIGQLGWLPFILITYFIGATISHALILAIHEITHNLSSKNLVFNNLLSFVANLPIVFPFAMTFKIYHGKHHQAQGAEGIDTDIPSRFEARIFRGKIGKICWYINQIIFYGLRPILSYPIKLNKWQIYNVIFQVGAMAIYLPFAGWSGLIYLLASLFIAGGLHPTAGHFISEHYVFRAGQETYSYYGPLNKLCFNVGYHNEHHDFPNIPGSRLPKLKKLAGEFYEPLHGYRSWVRVVWTFLFCDDISLYSRIKRHGEVG